MDADFDENIDTRWSTIDFVFSLFGGSILWRSCLQPFTTLSTFEVKYIGVTKTVKEALWLKSLMLEMGLA